METVKRSRRFADFYALDYKHTPNPSQRGELILLTFNFIVP